MPSSRTPQSDADNLARMDRLLRDIAANPDGPRSLALQSRVTRALQPVADAQRRVVKAMQAELCGELDAASARSAVETSLCALAEVLRLDRVPDDVVQQMRKEAAAAQRRQGPPAIESILPEVAGQSDVGHEHGLHLHGIRGTWHRLWALLVLAGAMGDSDDEAIGLVRAQLEAHLGRPMKPQEFDELRAHATAAAGKMILP